MEKEFQGVVERIGRPGLHGVIIRALMKLENQPWMYIDGENPKAVKEKLHGIKMGDAVVMRCEVVHHERGEYRVVDMQKAGGCG